MGYMQAYRVGNSQGEAPLGKISRLLTGEGIDCDDLGDSQPENGCVLIDFTSGKGVLVSKNGMTETEFQMKGVPARFSCD